ncbi:hypothetical protein [Stenotrophomonas sp. 2YAF26]|uniref:hypothetical protein n=1 Tax=Stenotrophomonas sp. 2YAF26 TaxID=3233030 RepID=UPI003F9DF380
MSNHAPPSPTRMSFFVNTLGSTVFVSLSLLLPAAQLTASPLDETFTAFSRCDASFFSSLHQHADAWAAHASLGGTGTISWIESKDRSDATNEVQLRGGPRIAGLPVTAYFDNASDLGVLGRYVAWGFTFDAPQDAVVKQLSPLIEHADRLQGDRGMQVRSEVRAGDQWLPTSNRGGIAAGRMLLERVLMMESSDGRTRVGCSLQGAVDADVMALLRPDVPAADRPQPQAAGRRLEDVPVSKAVVDGVDNPLLAPRFTSLTYRYRIKGKPASTTPTTITMVADNGLLKITEDYTSFTMQRLSKANLFQLASMRDAGMTLQTRSLKQDLPATWTPGNRFRAETTMVFYPERGTSKPLRTELSCVIGERFPAREVSASLSGDAIRLECKVDGDRSVRAFIEDLGIAVALESHGKYGSSLYDIIDFEVVR